MNKGNSLADRYRRVMEQAAEIVDLDSAAQLVGWDQETKMPKKGVEGRAHVSATLAGIMHERLTSPQLAEDLAALTRSLDELGEEEHGQVREMNRLHQRAVRVPPDLVRAMAEIQSRGSAVWAEAKAKKDFSAFAPTLEEIFQLKRREAEAVGFEDDPYDALLDEYEPGAKTSEIVVTLNGMREFLVPVVREIADSGKSPDMTPVAGPYDENKQDKFGREIIDAMGFDMNGGRLDTSNHPFTSGIHSGDTRLTTRYNPDLTVGLFGTLHEAGHGLYEQNLPEESRRTPLGCAASLGVHESQSRFWENVVGRSLGFWKPFYGRLVELFPEHLGSTSLEEFYRVINAVQPSLIRIEADEVTYNLHIVLRFEIERDVIGGRAQVKDLPEIWNQKFTEYLGIEPPSPDVGVMQDIHWSVGLIGYFPTYSLGNLYAAQLYEAVRRDMTDLNDQIERGKLVPLRDWLIEKVHRWGRRYPAKQLIERATGESISAEPFKRYIKGKFGPLYGLS